MARARSYDRLGRVIQIRRARTGGLASSGGCCPRSRPNADGFGGGTNRNGGTTTACWLSDAETTRRTFSLTNAVAPATISGQLSFSATLGGVGFWCSQGAAVAASGWHQTAHSNEAFGPTASVSTIERTAARNTLMLTLLRARGGPSSIWPSNRKFERFRISLPAHPGALRDFADHLPKIPQWTGLVQQSRPRPDALLMATKVRVLKERRIECWKA